MSLISKLVYDLPGKKLLDLKCILDEMLIKVNNWKVNRYSSDTLII